MNAVRLEQAAHNTDVCITNMMPGAVKTDIGINRKIADGSSMGYTDSTIAKGMSAERCAQLMSIAISNRVDGARGGRCDVRVQLVSICVSLETWISSKLLERFAAYSRQYTPSIHTAIFKRVAKSVRGCRGV
jgi:hypothetical protein